MAKQTKPGAPALQAMTKPEFAKLTRTLKDLHDAAGESAMEVAKGYKTVKKTRGINLDALKLIMKLRAKDNPGKVQNFLADFDKMRELAGFDDQGTLFEDDKTTPQKKAESAAVAKTTGTNVVPLKKSAKQIKAEAKAAKAQAKANSRVNRVSERKAAQTTKKANGSSANAEKGVKPSGRPSIFDEGEEQATTH